MLSFSQNNVRIKTKYVSKLLQRVYVKQVNPVYRLKKVKRHLG